MITTCTYIIRGGVLSKIPVWLVYYAHSFHALPLPLSLSLSPSLRLSSSLSPSLNIEAIYSASRAVEDAQFTHSLDNKSLLFHSSSVQNFVGILSR